MAGPRNRLSDNTAEFSAPTGITMSDYGLYAWERVRRSICPVDLDMPPNFRRSGDNGQWLPAKVTRRFASVHGEVIRCLIY